MKIIFWIIIDIFMSILDMLVTICNLLYCNLYFNSILLFEATNNETGIKPSLIYFDNKFLTKPTQQNVHKIMNTTLIGILTIIFGYKAGYKILVKLKVKRQQNIHNTTEENNELHVQIE